MKLKKISIVAIAALLVGIISVSAYTVENFSFTSVGNSDTTDEYLSAGTEELKAYNFASNIDATLGLSLSAKKWWGYSFISRCNPSTYGKTSVNCTWNESAGNYRGTLVFNSSNDGKSISGNFFLRTQY